MDEERVVELIRGRTSSWMGTYPLASQSRWAGGEVAEGGWLSQPQLLRLAVPLGAAALLATLLFQTGHLDLARMLSPMGGLTAHPAIRAASPSPTPAPKLVTPPAPPPVRPRVTPKPVLRAPSPTPTAHPVQPPRPSPSGSEDDHPYTPRPGSTPGGDE